MVSRLVDPHNVLDHTRTNVVFAGSVKLDDFDSFEVTKRLVCFEDTGATPGHLVHYEDRKMFVILDSGAFSAWTKGHVVDIDEYVETIIRHSKSVCMAANLDIIPGKQGNREVTEAENITAASDGWRNYIYILEKLKWRGRNDLCERIMPIHHQGESLDVLKRMIDFGCEYVGISPSNDATTSQRKKYLDIVYGYLTSLPKRIFTHGYAVTSEDLMSAYPWMTVDSISWIFTAGLGVVKTPFGNFSFSDDPRALKMKENLRIQVDEDGKISTGSSIHEPIIDELVKYLETIGIAPLDLSRHYLYRAKANILYFQGWELSAKNSARKHYETSVL